MRNLVLKSIKANTITTIALTITTFFLMVVCISLIGFSIHQTHHYHKLLKQQTAQLENILSDQMDSYLELAQAEEPMKKTYNNYPKKNMGKFQLSFYTPTELKKPYEQLRTATRTKPKEGRTIAVDPKVIPYGTLVHIEGFGYRIAEDTGSAIKGNRIDIFMMDYNKALSLGKPYANVTILGRK